MTIISKLDHPCHPHTLELTSKGTPFKCNSCHEFGLHTRYECPSSSCNFHLHKECADASDQPMISHPFYPRRIFSFLKAPVFLIRPKDSQIPQAHCDACARPIKGYNYHCQEKGLYLHPSCAMLPFKRAEDNHVTLLLRHKVSSKCYHCGQKRYRDEKRSWSYVSDCGLCHLHVACVKDMLMEGWEKEFLGRTNAVAVPDMPKLHIVLDKGKKRWSGRIAKYMLIVKIVIASIIGAIFGDPTPLIARLFTSITAE